MEKHNKGSKLASSVTLLYDNVSSLSLLDGLLQKIGSTLIESQNNVTAKNGMNAALHPSKKMIPYVRADPNGYFRRGEQGLVDPAIMTEISDHTITLLHKGFFNLSSSNRVQEPGVVNQPGCVSKNQFFTE